MDSARVEVFMLIHEETVRRYIKSFDINVVNSVRQFLEVFKCCGELVVILDKLIRDYENEEKIAAEQLSFTSSKDEGTRDKKEIQELYPLEVVVDICKYCGGQMLGEPIPSCERTESGRVFYQECSSCSFFVEIFQHVKTKKYKRLASK